jgi:hypothetical protein
MPHAPSLRSLFLTWVCFSLAFSTVFQAFLTTFLVDSGYETPIQTFDELFSSKIKLGNHTNYGLFLGNRDDNELAKLHRNFVNCASFLICLDWAINHRNVSVLFSDQFAELLSSTGYSLNENSEPLLCNLKDGVFFQSGTVMLMFPGDPLLKRVNEIIGRVVEAGIYNYWTSLRFHWLKLSSQKMAILQQLDEYYSFNLYHMHPAFYLLLIGWCLSAFCFIVEVLYNRVFRKTK